MPTHDTPAPTHAPTAAPAPSGTPAPSLPALHAQSAGAFVRGVGINMHNSYYGTGYTANVPAVESLVEKLGVSIVRDGMATGQSNVCAEDAALGAAGLRFDVITNVGVSASDVASWVTCIGSQNVASFEGPNEYDISHPASDTNWPQTLAAAQRSLDSLAHASYPGKIVIGPSVTSSSAAAQLGSLASWLDLGNAHVYFNAYYPENGGYGAGGYGSMAYGLAVPGPIFGAKPLAVTETGYDTATGAGSVSEAVQAKYVVRMLLDYANLGVAETIPYELIDEGGAPFSNMGLVRADLSPKPAYTALAGMLALLHDRGSATGSIGCAMSGQTQNVDTAFFKRSDGTYVLALWLAVASSDPNSGADIAVPPQTVTLTFSRNLVAPSNAVYDATSTLRTTKLTATNAIPLTVTDQAQFVTFE